MAVGNYGNRMVLGAAADALTGKYFVQAIALDHTAAANCILQDSAGDEIVSLRTTANELTKWVEFPSGLWVEGIVAQTLSAGQVTIYVK